MADSKEQVFSGISPQTYAVLTEKAREAGIELRGNKGTASKMGVEVAYEYSPEKQELALECLHTPFFMSTEQVNARLASIVKESIERA